MTSNGDWKKREGPKPIVLNKNPNRPTDHKQSGRTTTRKTNRTELNVEITFPGDNEVKNILFDCFTISLKEVLDISQIRDLALINLYIVTFRNHRR